MAKIKTAAHDDYIIEKIKNDPSFGLEYINAALHDDSDDWFEGFMISLGHFLSARGLNATKLSGGKMRDTFYKAFNKHRNPTIKTFKTILDSAGVEMIIKRKKTGG